MWYKFISYNTQSIYGFGTESEAVAYCNYLNSELENYYSFCLVGDELAEELNSRNYNFNLSEELEYIKSVYNET